jgi:MFS family permease
MTIAGITAGPLSEVEHGRQLRRALIASTVGTTIEWYDFLLYGQVTGLVFGKLFFPQSDPVVGVLQAFAVFFVGFLGRPIGAAIFGHWGDRIGRKATLIATLLVTGLATMAVGLVPTYESIGIWGAVLLVIIRLIQGIGVGGEWGGSVLLAMEWARTNKNRGLLAAWPQFGGPAGLFLANLAVLFFSWFSGDQFLVWDSGFRSFSASSWLGSVCGSGSASRRPRSSRRCSTKNASNACRSWKCSSVSRSRSR